MPVAASYQGYHIPIFWDWNAERRVNGKGSPKHLTEWRGLLPTRAWNLYNLQMLERALMERKRIKNYKDMQKGPDKDGSGRNKHVTKKGKRQPLLNRWRSVSFLSNALHPIARPSPIFLLNYISKYFPRGKLELDRLQVPGMSASREARDQVCFLDILYEIANKH